MAGPVRNFCVARGTVIKATYSTLYTVPANTSFILKSMVLSLGSPEASPTWSAVLYAPGGPGLWLSHDTFATSDHIIATYWIVLNAGDQLHGQTGPADVLYWISGALLPYGSAVPPVAVAEMMTPPSPPHHGPPDPEPQRIRLV